MFLDLNTLYWKSWIFFTFTWASNIYLQLIDFVCVVSRGPSFIKLIFSFLVISPTKPLGSFALCAVFSCQWFDTDALEQIPLPMPYEGNVTDFQKLLLLRCFRVDRMYRAVTDYVTVTMGETWVTHCPLSHPSHCTHTELGLWSALSVLL